MTRYVVIGTGVSGVSAAVTLRETDGSGEIFIVGEDPFVYYSRPGLAYYLTGEVPEKQLYPFDRLDWQALDVHFIKSKAIGIDRGAHKLEIQNSPSLGYDRLLLATGAESQPLNVAGETLDGVVKLDDMQDARRILSLSKSRKAAVVVGGGVSSLELVEGLVAQGVKVHYFLRGERYWANVLDTPESSIIERHLTESGVVLHYHTEIEEICGRRGRVDSVRTKKGEIIRCGIAGICIGVRPRVELARQAGLAVERGILTNEYLQTSDPDIYASGDCAQVFDPQTRHSFVDSLWTPGRNQSCTAALNMAGQRQIYRRNVDINVLRLAGIMITIIGAVGSGRDDDLVSVARGSSETWRALPNSLTAETGNEINHVRLMVGERTLLGALILGDQKLSLPLQEMVSRQIDISPIRAQLLERAAPLGKIVMDFWCEVSQ